MKIKNRKFHFPNALGAILISFNSLFAKNVLVELGVESVYGIQVFETRTKIPEESNGIGSGSRISYDRKIPRLTTSIKILGDRHEFGFGLNSTMNHSFSSGKGVDEDFYLTSSSQARPRTRLNPFYGTYPSVYNITGIHNWNISDGNIKLNETMYSGEYRYYTGSARPNPYTLGVGFFLPVSIYYTESKYSLSNSNSYSLSNSNGLRYRYLYGANITHRNFLTEFGSGFGFRSSFPKWGFESSLQFLRLNLHARDQHLLRRIDFIEDFKGYSLLYSLRIFYKFTNNILGQFDFKNHRTYAYGIDLRVSGGETLPLVLYYKSVNTRQLMWSSIEEKSFKFSIGFLF